VEKFPTVNIVLLQAAYIHFVESLVESSLVQEQDRIQTSQDIAEALSPRREAGPTAQEITSVNAGEEYDLTNTDSGCDHLKIWDSAEKGGISKQALEALQTSGNSLAEVMKLAPQKSKFTGRDITRSKNLKLPAEVDCVYFKAGSLDPVELFNVVHAHGGSKVCSMGFISYMVKCVCWITVLCIHCAWRQA
jgi:hypothetical protein